MDSEHALVFRERAAIVIAAFFHLIGLTGLLFFPELPFAALTPFNFLVVLALLFWSREKNDVAFLKFSIITWLLGFAAEVIGVNTGWLFGEYRYGDSLGPKVFEVPLLIGVNWLLVILGSRVWAAKTIRYLSVQSPAIVAVLEVVLGAFLATAFDWVIEPAAIRLGYWSWVGESIPLWNYICWFLVSALMLAIGRFRPFSTRDPYAAYLLVIQAQFFLVLRLFWGLF